MAGCRQRGANAFGQLARCQQADGHDDTAAWAMLAGLDWVEPGALDRQATDDQPDGLQPGLRAIRGTGNRSALVWAIWQRRRVKASDERKPALTARRSASVKGRTTYNP